MKIIAFTVADETNKPLAEKMIASFHHFHPGIEVKIFNQDDVGASENYYRATPMFAKDLIDEYDLVLKLDADQIVTGDLNYIFEQEYDVAGVMNFSRSDVKEYGPVSVHDIEPLKYFNCGLVAMKSKRFIDHWWALCNSYHFYAPQNPYREQDLLNILVHYCDYNVLNLDEYNHNLDYSAWHGLLSKGEWHKMEIRGDELILPKAEDRYPERDKKIKVMHFAGGQANKNKMKYRLYCSEQVIEYLDRLVKGSDVKKD